MIDWLQRVGIILGTPGRVSRAEHCPVVIAEILGDETGSDDPIDGDP
jgi:hypothetical protein